MKKLLQFLKRLDDASIHYVLAHHRDEAIMVIVSVPGERWEVEFMVDGEVEVERFVSQGVDDGNELESLIERFAD